MGDKVGEQEPPPQTGEERFRIEGGGPGAADSPSLLCYPCHPRQSRRAPIRRRAIISWRPQAPRRRALGSAVRQADAANL